MKHRVESPLAPLIEPAVLAFAVRPQERDAIIGVSVSDTTIDTKIVIASVTANSRTGVR